MKVARVSAKATKQSQGSLRAAVPDEDRCLRQVVNGFFTVYSASRLPTCLPQSCILINSECELSPARITVTTPAKTS